MPESKQQKFSHKNERQFVWHVFSEWYLVEPRWCENDFNIHDISIFLRGVKREAIEGSDKVTMTHVNLNDDTVEGIKVKDKKAFSVQYHPESSPGPHDSRYLFDDFINLIKK